MQFKAVRVSGWLVNLEVLFLTEHWAEVGMLYVSKNVHYFLETNIYLYLHVYKYIIRNTHQTNSYGMC